MSVQTDRHTAATVGLAGVSIVAGGLVAAVDSAAPFAHGAWLAAYLVLVCGVSQILLDLGQAALRAAAPAARVRTGQTASWNAGALAVAAGVLVSSPAVVAAGSLVLLLGLGCFATGAGRGRPGVRGWAIAYHAVIAGLAISVVVGSALAGAAPGGAL